MSLFLLKFAVKPACMFETLQKCQIWKEFNLITWWCFLQIFYIYFESTINLNLVGIACLRNFSSSWDWERWLSTLYNIQTHPTSQTPEVVFTVRHTVQCAVRVRVCEVTFKQLKSLRFPETSLLPRPPDLTALALSALWNADLVRSVCLCRIRIYEIAVRKR